MSVGVIVVAAGRGTRLGGAVPKQYLPVAGVPLLLRALRPFAEHPAVAHVVLVLPPADAARPPSWLAPLGTERFSVVAGGAERSDSVAAGLAALPAACTTVLVHDGARPFVARPTIDGVIAVARRGEAAVAAVPITDTVKEADRSDPSLVRRTIPRDLLWRAQTPQGFPRALLERAHQEARRTGQGATDDAALVERLGLPVRLVADSPRNLKVTTADDLVLAECWAAQP